MNNLNHRPSLICSILILIGLIFHPVNLFGQVQFPKNSTAKLRVKPGPLAAKIGSAVEWRTNVEQALEEAKTTGKPVFWYVPTVRGTFMDRKDSIDRYMLAGPFSWPAIIGLLNDHFIPVKAAPKQTQQQAYDLKPYVFVEPGFVILSDEGTLVARFDRLTTLHPSWMFTLISSFAKPAAEPPVENRLAQQWTQFAAGDFSQIQFPKEETVESLLLAGMVDFRLGNHAAARQKWERASRLDESSPLAWKAAAEAEGLGPFVRGFEVFDTLPETVLLAASKGQSPLGSAAPANAYQEFDLWQRSINFLLGMQAEDGGWHDSDYDFGGTDSLPNVRAAVTSIAGMALLEAQIHGHLDAATQAKVQNALERAIHFVQDNKNLNLDDRDEIFWAYAYRVRFLARWVRDDAKLQPALLSAVKDLESIQMSSGGWFHEYPNPMTTSMALLALAESSQAGVAAKEETIRRGVESLKGDRFGNGAFTYSSSRRRTQPAAGGQAELFQAAGRMPLCELGLWLHQHSSQELLANAIQKSFELSEPMMKALKYDNHTSNYAYGGFFIWYDIEARGQAIEQLEDSDLKNKFQTLQRELVLSLPEIDGCFVDSHELGRVYGTAMGLISLAQTKEQVPPN